MRRPRTARRLPLAALALGLPLVAGCEDLDGEPSPAPAAATPADEGGARSAYGKAYERAEQLEQEIQAYQDEVIKTADGVFDDSAARRRELETPPGE